METASTTSDPQSSPTGGHRGKPPLFLRLVGARFLNRQSIGWKLNLGFGLLVGLTFLVVVFNAFGSSLVTQYINRTGDLRVPAALTSAHAQASLLKMVSDAHGYLALSDLSQIADYYAAQRDFEADLDKMELLAQGSAAPESARRLSDLKLAFTDWAALSEKMFQLHNNPRLNQPGLHLYTLQVQPSSVAILDETDNMIQLQEQRPFSDENSTLLKNMIDFRTSFDTMITNLYGFTVARDFNFKAGYLAQLPSNTTAWENLRQQQAWLTPEQRAQFSDIDQVRDTLLQWPNQIFDASEGEHAYEDLYLFRTQSVPQAEQMLGQLNQMTTDQQTLLQSDLSTGRADLTNAQLQSLIVGLFALLFAIGMAAIFREILAGSLQRLRGAAERIAGGDLQVHAAVESTDEIGQLASTFNLMTDRLRETIARLEKQTQQLEKLKQVAEAASVAKSEFLTNMSHELRTPLNGILGYAQILNRDEQLSPAQANAVGIIRACGEHLLTLINDILDLSKIEARKMELHPTDVHLPSFLDGIVGMFHIRAQQKKSIVFSYEKITKLPSIVRADEKRLRQVLINLIGNAIKFTDQGEVVFRVGLIDPAASSFITTSIEPLETEATCHLRFEVIDTGIGMTPEQLKRIFLPFEQVSDPQHRVEGTGLGLAITQSLVEAMHGKLEVESNLGQGSTFRLELELPVWWTPIDTPEPAWEREIVGYAGERRKILVVDDEDHNRLMLVNLIKPLGFQVSEAVDGKQAIERAVAIQPDAILMDLILPSMPGLEAAREIRQISELNSTNRVVIIATSANAFEKDVQASALAGCDAFLTKPIEVQQLCALLEKHLQLKWIYKEPHTEETYAPETLDDKLIFPPRGEMVALLDLALKGELPRLRQRATQIEQMGKQYKPFADKLGALVDAYDEDQILALVGRNGDNS